MKKINYFFRDRINKENGDIDSLAQILNKSLRSVGSSLRVSVQHPYVVVTGEIPSDKILSESFLEYVKFEEVEVEEGKVTKLPPGKPKKTSWKSRNRGGGVKHNNFDRNNAKTYDHLKSKDAGGL